MLFKQIVLQRKFQINQINPFPLIINHLLEILYRI